MTDLDAAERLRGVAEQLTPEQRATFQEFLDAALAAERRATVERIRPDVPHREGCATQSLLGTGLCDCGVDAMLDAAILDAVAER